MGTRNGIRTSQRRGTSPLPSRRCPSTRSPTTCCLPTPASSRPTCLLCSQLRPIGSTNANSSLYSFPPCSPTSTLPRWRPTIQRRRETKNRRTCRLDSWRLGLRSFLPSFHLWSCFGQQSQSLQHRRSHPLVRSHDLRLDRRYCLVLFAF